MEKLINFSKKLEHIVSKNDLLDAVSSLRRELAIKTTKELEAGYRNACDTDRLLKVGILGRVKSGKSSLLNALIFDGESVLPKAATPMTAALTVLQYGEQTKAEIDFFTAEDIADIKKDAERYENLIKRRQEEEQEKQIKRLKKKNPDASQEQLKDVQEKAGRIALREAKREEVLSSAHEQYERMRKAPISPAKLEQHKCIEAESMEELNGKLFDFVGSSGKYMPYTKSVTISINQENLNDLQIIDTPGVNDPVVSREERTREFMKDCDVVLMVSPAGQFLSSEDLNLMDRITAKEGIRELYIVASQADNQLYGSAKENNGGVFNNVVSSIESDLSSQQKEIISSYQRNNPEIAGIFDNLIQQKVITNSSVCYQLQKHFRERNTWDENMEKVWENLTRHYPDNFNAQQSEQSLFTLKKLSNIDAIQGIIDKIRLKKDKIIEEEKSNYQFDESKKLHEYQERLIQKIEGDISEIENTDIEGLRKEKEEIAKRESEAISRSDEAYNDTNRELKGKLSKIKREKIKRLFEQPQSDLRSSQGSETKTWTEKTEGNWYKLWFDSKTETKSREYSTVKAGVVRNSLENLTYNLEENISGDVELYNDEYRANLYKNIVSTLREHIGDEYLDARRIRTAISNVLSKIPEVNITYHDDFPQKLKKSGTLKESEAEHFIEAANDYISALRQRISNDVKEYISELMSILRSYQVGEEIFKAYKKDLEELEKDIKNKEMALERKNSTLEQLKSIEA